MADEVSSSRYALLLIYQGTCGRHANGRKPAPSILGKQLGGGPPPGKWNERHFDLIRLFEARFHYDVGRTLQ